MGAPTVFSRAAFYFDIQACSTVPEVFPTVLSQVFAPPCPRYFQPYLSCQSVKYMFSGRHSHFLFLKTSYTQSIFDSICSTESIVQIYWKFYILRPYVLSRRGDKREWIYIGRKGLIVKGVCEGMYECSNRLWPRKTYNCKIRDAVKSTIAIKIRW